MEYSLFLVGGIIRDELLGIKSKDVDYSVVLADQDLDVGKAFDLFCDQIESEGFDIKVKHPNVLTVRAMFPEGHVHSGVADFVIARKEIVYPKGSRTPEVVLGTFYDDMVRRDFTVNALAKDIDGNIIDLFGGKEDLYNSILRTPSDAIISFNNDPLRILRALRFHVTKGLSFSDKIVDAIRLFEPKRFRVVSAERIMAELHKMFQYSTVATLKTLWDLKELNDGLYYEIFRDQRFWLEPTNKKR